MRWVKPTPGCIRQKTWFAWWPVRIYRETRWMEWVTVEMEWCSLENILGVATAYYWEKRRFIDPPKPEPKPQPVVVEDVHTRKVELDDE